MRDRLIALEFDPAVADVSEGRDYWLLLKPNVMSLVVFSAAAGLYLAPGSLHPLLMAVAILCIAVAAGAAGAINNSYDADIDRVMARTRRRPTATGRIRPDDALAFGVTLACMSVMVMGLAGMPRRIPDYPDAFAGWNFVASLGAYISAVGVLIFFYLLYKTFTSGERCPANPWGEGATTLEWTVSSPPPFHTFNELPQVR